MERAFNRTTHGHLAPERRQGGERPARPRHLEKNSEGQHPIYEETVPGNEIPGGPFTADEQAAIAAICDGKAVPYELGAQSRHWWPEALRRK